MEVIKPEKIKKFKNLQNLPGFNFFKKPVKFIDNINIKNNIIKDDNVIEEKIFVKFFTYINNSKKKKFTRKNYYKKSKETKKETKKK